MNILIYGAGVIGCTYGWQLASVGYNVNIMVREARKKYIDEHGININSTDLRNGKKITQSVSFRPKTIDTLLPDNDYDYIIVTAKNINLLEILPILKESAGKAHILFFQNIWINDIEMINRYLSPKQYFFGFPFMAGGGRHGDEIISIISGSKYSQTMLGEVTGETSLRVQKIADALDKANLKPLVSKQIITWLIPHCAFMAGITACITLSGRTMKTFLADKGMVKCAILSIREGFSVCEKMGINPKQEKVNKLYYLPLFISSPVVRKVFKDDAMQEMFNQYLRNSDDEVERMLKDIIDSGNKNNVKTPHLDKLLSMLDNEH